MLISPPELAARTSYRPDICVVGAGFAGYEVARVAAERGFEVLIIESGLKTFDPEIQAISATTFTGSPLKRSGEFNADLSEAYRGLAAVRELGGTSNAWSGKWKPLDPLDLVERSWIANSGWPIAWNEMATLYDEVWRDYADGVFAMPSEGEAPAGLEISSHYEEPAPLRLKDRFLALAERSGVTLCTGLTAVRLEFQPHGDEARVARLLARSSLQGGEHVVEADQFVMALGGLENPRLLLASFEGAEGVALNRHDAVGRYYMDHPKIERKVSLGLLSRAPRFAASRADHHRGWRLSDDAQRETRTLNHALYVYPRRRPIRGDRLTYRLYLEQAPVRESRVSLGANRDKLGLPEIVVDSRFGDGAEEELARFIASMAARLKAAGVKPPPFEANMLGRGEFSTASHHMGGTRMANRPEDGAVTADCQLFGTTNLYVAGSSVFPTSGNANPTLTLIALARRLARKLTTVV